MPTDSRNKSFHWELEVEETTKFEQTIDNLKSQVELLNKTIIYLSKETQLIKKVNISVTHKDQETSKRTSKKTFKNTSRDAEDLTSDEPVDENVIKVTKYVTKPILTALGELFSRYDKKLIPTFKRKLTDKLKTEWLNCAKHAARKKGWDDDKKKRFFSDRLKGKAIKWNEDYAEVQFYELK